MRKFKLVLKILITLPFVFFIVPAIVYCEFEGEDIPNWLDGIGNKWGNFLKGEER